MPRSRLRPVQRATRGRSSSRVARRLNAGSALSGPGRRVVLVWAVAGVLAAGSAVGGVLAAEAAHASPSGHSHGGSVPEGHHGGGVQVPGKNWPATVTHLQRHAPDPAQGGSAQMPAGAPVHRQLSVPA